MHPPRVSDKANHSERILFTAFEGMLGRDDWVILTGLQVAQHVAGLSGEVDAIVIAPGHGILLIEAKTAEHVEYRDGEWFLAKNPSPTKNPLAQLDGARRSIRHFLRQRDLLTGDEPIARLVWFTNLGRWQFDNATPHDLTFFEWELAWADDLAHPAALVEKTLAAHNAWFGEAENVAVDPRSLTPEHANDIADALLASFTAVASPADRRRQRLIDERALLEEQEHALELLETNKHVFFDGPAGCGKSWLVAVAARRHARAGRRTLLTCWNLLMADELRSMAGGSPLDLEIADLNAVMLRVAGLDANPPNADDAWFRGELPQRALAALGQHPERGNFDAICVDEFQDIAGVPVLMRVLAALTSTADPAAARLVFAGDGGQQIMRARDDRADPLLEARRLASALVHARVRRNCRVAPRLLQAISSTLARPLDHSGDRMPASTPSALTVDEVAEGRELPALLSALKRLLEQYGPEDIVVLSPFGPQSSLVGRFVAREPVNKEERALAALLTGDSAIAWRSIFKSKGLDAAAVVITDVTPEAMAWADEHNLSWNDLLYVGMTRARYACTVLRRPGTPWRSPHDRMHVPHREGVRVLGGGGPAAAVAASAARTRPRL